MEEVARNRRRPAGPVVSQRSWGCDAYGDPAPLAWRVCSFAETDRGGASWRVWHGLAVPPLLGPALRFWGVTFLGVISRRWVCPSTPQASPSPHPSTEERGTSGGKEEAFSPVGGATVGCQSPARASQSEAFRSVMRTCAYGRPGRAP